MAFCSPVDPCCAAARTDRPLKLPPGTDDAALVCGVRPTRTQGKDGGTPQSALRGMALSPTHAYRAAAAARAALRVDRRLPALSRRRQGRACAGTSRPACNHLLSSMPSDQACMDERQDHACASAGARARCREGCGGDGRSSALRRRVSHASQRRRRRRLPCVRALAAAWWRGGSLRIRCRRHRRNRRCHRCRHRLRHRHRRRPRHRRHRGRHRRRHRRHRRRVR